MTTLADRLRAAIDETERIAQAATPGPWSWAHRVGPYKYGLVSGQQMVLPLAVPDIYPHRDDAAHIARHDPAAVLRRCAADRKLLDMWQLSPERELQARIGDWTSCSDSCPPTIGEYVLATLAEAYGVEA